MKNTPVPEPPPVDAEAESLLRELSTQLTSPAAGDCLLCHVDRMLAQFGCDGTLRFALAYRDAVAPAATALAKRLWDVGGFCDCEIFLNGFSPVAELWTPGRWQQYEDGSATYVDPAPPKAMPPCRTVRRGSTRACALWERTRREDPW